MENEWFPDRTLKINDFQIKVNESQGMFMKIHQIWPSDLIFCMPPAPSRTLGHIIIMRGLSGLNGTLAAALATQKKGDCILKEI